MSENTKIEWATHTQNFWEGCQKTGPGCDNCYAEARNARFAGGVAINWGPGAPRRRTSAANWAKPLAWNANHKAFFAAHGHRQRVFCSSLADVFDNAVDPVWRDDMFTVIANTPNLDWLLLTKRIGNAATMLPWMPGYTGPDGQRTKNVWRNVWLGATIVNQEEADRDIPKLLAVPAVKRFLSIEPMLGPINIEPYLLSTYDKAAHDDQMVPGLPTTDRLDWIIVGGESGPGARPMHPDWARSLRDQCEAAGVPFLFKQWGEFAEVDGDYTLDPAEADANGFCRTDCVITPEGQVYQHPNDLPDDVPGRWMHRPGKKAAGRMLDGRTWDGFPT